MRKEHLIALAFGFGILAVAAGLYLMQPVDEPLQEETISELVETPVEPESDIIELEEDQDFLMQSGEVTRIIIDDQDEEAEDISGILSEKVLINDEVVDQSELDELNQ
ncbi:hypothetical protein [Endozoicomonas numazuensis]|uniref:Uncharacterized protein n=1 Tax=Endozoicomonas numazuensis TaxID=1137799 RepID=A0A081NMW8_9GAMM|nr:hypothetical protein [Endozoicomonas numazuensis]KEQ19791.1 hypothetical protein GZ78_07980 [Endozoicomonas numazuensis]